MGDFWAPLGWPKMAFSRLSEAFVWIIGFTSAGAEFVFGDLGRAPEGNVPQGMELIAGSSWGNFFAFQAMPTLIFFGSLMAMLYHLGVIQWLVNIMALGVRKALGTSGAESLSAVSNIFVGMTEAPLVIKAYLDDLTRSEMMAVMAGGMATIAGTVMGAYIVILGTAYAGANGIEMAEGQLRFAEHLLGASLMAAPAALIIAKIMVPETGAPKTRGKAAKVTKAKSSNIIEAAASGTSDGLKLALNVTAMLIAFLAIIALLDAILGWGTGLFGYSLTLGEALGVVFAPIAWCMGVPSSDILSFGSLIGISIVANEFVSYLQLASQMAPGMLEPKTVVMATFAMCGFANLSSIGILIGGIAPLAPKHRGLVASLGLRAVLAGTLANMLTATIAGFLAT